VASDPIPLPPYVVPEHSLQTLPCPYDEDETGWLETMARLLAERRFEELDHEHLSEFLWDMARRDKREVLSRLSVLIAHLLKWDHQPDQRSNSWRATIVVQRQELQELFESRTLRDYAREVLGKAYVRAVAQTSVETGLSKSSFPAACPFALEAIVTGEESPRQDES
jgi:hypothetical protein